MEFFDVVRRRRSVRKFSDRMVSDEDIRKIVQAAHIAPSGSNQKNWHFIIVKSDNVKEALKKAITDRIDGLLEKMGSKKARDEFSAYARYFTFFADAPVVIAVVAKPYDSTTARIIKRYDKNFKYSSSAGIQGVAAAIQNMLLAAADIGLGTCWMTGPLIAREGLERVLQVEPPNELAALVPLGYPAKEPRPNELPGSIDDIITEL